MSQGDEGRRRRKEGRKGKRMDGKQRKQREVMKNEL